MGKSSRTESVTQDHFQCLLTGIVQNVSVNLPCSFPPIVCNKRNQNKIETDELLLTEARLHDTVNFKGMTILN